MSKHGEHADLEHRDIDVGDGLRLHATIAGAGPPLVLLHGFTGSRETWTPLRASLGTAWTTIALDLPGHGRSSAPEEPSRYALSRFADDLDQVLDMLALDRVALLGYSMGGRAAMQFAIRRASRVVALVLESVSPGIGDATERMQRLAADATLAAAIERDGIDAFVERWEALPLWESQRRLSDDVRAELTAQRRANSSRGLANCLRGAGAAVEPALAEQLSELHVPALLIAGALDAKYVASGRVLERAIPAARLAIVSGAGHAVHLEEPAEFVALVTRFLLDTSRTD